MMWHACNEPADGALRRLRRTCYKHQPRVARVAELADALDLGSSGVPVGVRVPPLALVRTPACTKFS